MFKFSISKYKCKQKYINQYSYKNIENHKSIKIKENSIEKKKKNKWNLRTLIVVYIM